MAMSHIGFAEEATTQLFFKLTIRPQSGHAGEGVRPGTHDKSLDIAVGGLAIPADALIAATPSRRRTRLRKPRMEVSTKSATRLGSIVAFN